MTVAIQADVATVPTTAKVGLPNVISTVPTPSAPVPSPASVKAVAKRVAKTPVQKVAAAVRPVAKVAIQPVARKATARAAVKSVARTTPAGAAKAAVKIQPNVEPNEVIAATAKQSGTKPLKAKKQKLVRDSFTIPKLEYLILEELKHRSGKLGNSMKKSELIRAGIKALAAMSDTSFLKALYAVPAIKTGRPAKD